MGSRFSTRRRRRATATTAALGMLLLGSPVLASPASAALPGDDESTLRIGVLALTGAISAVGQTPELATPLPFTTTSLADVLGLDASLTASFDDALQGTDLEDALEQVEGIDLVDDGDADTIAFTYARSVTQRLNLVHDDGDLRFGANQGAGNVTVSLTTDDAHPFVVAVDPDQADPLLRVALVSQPVMDLSVDIDRASLSPFAARQGFTGIDVTGGHYRIHRDQQITMRDPDGRGVLTLEDLRYSTLPDLFRVATPVNTIDVELDAQLPSTLTGGDPADRRGTLSVDTDDTPLGGVWPTASDATRTYGDELKQATGLSMVDGLTSLAQYTGTVLALQDAADVPFPHLGGGTADLFAPGDRLLELLSTAAAAQVVCGLAPENPPVGVAAPGDTVYCQATTAQGLGTLGDVEWALKDGGNIVGTPPASALGTAPEGLVEVSGSDGEPDLQVTFTAGGHELTARSMPHTVQDVVDRIGELPGSTASAALTAGRLDVAVDVQDDGDADLALGNPGVLGALVGLTGLTSPDPDAPATAEAAATDASFDVGFGIETGEPAKGEGRATYLLPADASLLTIDDLSVTAPAGVTGLAARIGFLEVTADLASLSLGKQGAGPAVELQRVLTGGAAATDPLLITDLLNDQGALDPDQLELDSAMTAGIGFTAHEVALSAGQFATGEAGGASGTATVAWGPQGLPSVSTGGDYGLLRVFDPVPAAFLSGEAVVTPGATENDDDSVDVVVTLPSGTTLNRVLNVGPGSDVEVARRLIADGVACQNVTIVDGTTLTCEELAPNGEAEWTDGQDVELIVLGDPFAMRDSVIEGLATALAGFDLLNEDHVDESPALAFDQYTSTLPLVDLTPAQLAVERDALRDGIAAIDAAATQDELGGATVPVSSAQELAEAVDDLVKVGTTGGYGPALSYTLGTDLLGVSLSADSPAGTSLVAPLRLDDVGTTDAPGRGQVMSGLAPNDEQATVRVQVDSATTLAIDVDRETARSSVADATGTSSNATFTGTDANLAGHPLQAGVGELDVDNGSTAGLGVRVVTDYVVDGGTGQLETTRSNSRPSGRAAVAELVVGTGDVISYAADATDSSGGAGATQPAPDAMQVKFLAEGLDGLAAALESAMDGAAPRNFGPDGAPISAPLIGTNLDAGAGVPDILTELTSALRDELEDAAVADLDTASDLAAELDDAVERAVGDTEGLEGINASDVDVEIECEAGTCEPCPDPDPDDPQPCTVDGPTIWKTVSISTTLTGEQIDSTTPFETGLAGLEVRSDNTVDTSTSWTLPITLQLTRGVGPQVVIESGDALELDVSASLPSGGIDAIVGYLPAHLSVDADGRDGAIDTAITIEPAVDTYDLFDLYDGNLTASPSFAGADEEGLSLGFATIEEHNGKNTGVFGLKGVIDIPWTAAGGFEDDVTYNDVTLNVGDVIAAVATPFAVVDPYLAPVRDVVDVLRTPIPVVSDLSELGGGDEVSLLSLLETLSAATEKPQLELAHRVIGLVGGATGMISALAALSKQDVPLDDLSAVGELLSVAPSDVELYDKCTETVSTSSTAADGTTTTKKTAPKPCPVDDEADEGGAPGQTTDANRKGTRKTSTKVAETTRNVTGQLPGFSLPFLSDPDQLIDVLTGEGEASYFRLDLGTLTASVAYTQKFGPIMAGPVPIVPFVGGSISVEGRLAMGFDSYPQTLAARSVSPGDVSALLDLYGDFDGGDVIREGFYIDDLDADGVDVPEVKLVTTLEAGAGVSIGIVTAGLKGGVTLTINLDLNDPDDDGRLRTAEIRTMFAGDATCIFDASAEIEAFISIFVEIELLLTSLSYEFDILRLGPYELFSYGCPDAVPTLVVRTANGLTLTTGDRSPDRLEGAGELNDKDLADEFEVRQFDKDDGLTAYEISGFGRVQNVEVQENDSDWTVTIYQSGISLSTQVQGAPFTMTTKPTFEADGGNLKDQISFLAGEEFVGDEDAELELRTSPFSTRVTRLTGGPDDDLLVTGAGNDSGIDGGPGNDSIETGLGNDVATGGSGHDVVGGGAGRDDLSGGSGNDRLEGGPGGDRINGEAGNDSLLGGSGRDVRALLVRPNDAADDVVQEQVRLGFDSGDVLVGGSGADTVDGGDGSDVVVGGEASELTGATLASLFETGSREVNVLTEGATEEDDATFGTEPVDIDTAATPDPAMLDTLCVSGTTISGSDSSDFVTGGPEADIVVGGNAADVLDGGAGPDEICGRAGDDQISGDGSEDDDGDNADIIRGGTGNDRADGGPGDDVMFGDDVTLVRGGARVLNGSLGGDATGAGTDYLDGGDGDDVIAGGDGSDLLLGDQGDDATYGEGRDTVAGDGTAPGVEERLLACNQTTRVIRGLVDLDGDLFAGAGGDGLTADTGQLAGLAVTDGVIGRPGSSAAFEGLLSGEFVVIGGRVDLDRNGTAGNAGDTGFISLPSMLDTGANSQGDCILAGDGHDELRGGEGSDYLGAGDGTDLADGGDGNDLLLGDGGTDVLLGGPHHDVLVGGTGNDHLVGGNGDDRLRGNEGADDLIGGSDISAATDGQDVLLGGREDDVLVAENGIAVSSAIVDAVTDDAVQWAGSSLAPDAVTAGEGSELVFDDSALLCGEAVAADRWLTLLEDDGSAGDPEQSPGTPLAYDELYGGYDCDVVIGSIGDDLVRGGQDDDLVEAGPGADLAFGDEGEDVVIGGSSVDPTRDTDFTTDRSGGAGTPDGADEIRGDGGPDGLVDADLVAGDNALPIRVTGLAGPDYVLQLHDVGLAAGEAPAGNLSGADLIDGDGGDDRLFGQGGADVVNGDDGDDYVEGNDGGDTVTGGDGADDLIGGSSSVEGTPLGGTGGRLLSPLDGPFDGSAAGLRDLGLDTISGGEGDDVVLGDNGRITRPTSGERHIARADEAPDATDVSDADDLNGGADDDRLFGQRGNDLIDAGAGVDHVEGNEGADGLTGGPDADVIIGGSSLSPDNRGTLADALTRARTQLDGNDNIYGDLPGTGTVASDLILGDNATVLRLGSGRLVTQLADVGRTTGPAPVIGTSGDDTILGGTPPAGGAGAPDRVFGQGGADTITTGPAGDYVEGNAGDDTVSSGDGADDVIGGSSATNGRPLGDTGERLQQRMSLRLDTSAAGLLDGLDEIRGGGGNDTVLGDNGRITRPTDGQRPVPDVAMADTADAATYGSDLLFGDDGDDVLYGQLDDGVALGTGDELDGGAGHDTLLGDLAVVTMTPATAKTFSLKSDAISETVSPPNGSTVPKTYVPEGQATNGGPDIAWGGAGNDTLHLGGGADLGNGGSGTDTLFGGDGDDALWGGIGHDRIFGGYGADDLDLKIRSGDPEAYDRARDEVDGDGTETTDNDDDLIYGGWGPDELQADVGGTGKQPVTDHLIDWVGAHNVYYVCAGAYGAGRVVRQSGPGMQELLTGIALAAGAAEPTSVGSGGWFDLGMVFSSDKNGNNDRSPEHPGHFTCG